MSINWLNRHLSFGEYGEVGANDESLEGFDRYIKRRELSNIARAQASKAFRPGQHVGIDDGVCVRQRMPTAMQAMRVAEESESGMRTRAGCKAHMPIHVASENRFKRRRGEQVPSGAPVRGWKCTRSDCAPCSTRRPDIFCPGCNSWYHLPCFSKLHTCTLNT